MSCLNCRAGGIGTVVKVEGNRAAVNIGSDNNPVITPLIRWSVPAAGAVTRQRVPSLGEQVVLFNTNPGGDCLSSMVIIGYLHSEKYPAPHTTADMETVTTGGYTAHINTSGAKQESGNTQTVSMSTSISTTTGTVTTKADKVTADTPQFTITGALTALSATIQTALSAGDGMMSASSAGVKINGLVESVKAKIGGINFLSHRHTEKGDGAPTSTPIE